MYKKLTVISLALWSQYSLAAHSIQLHQASFEHLKQFPIISKTQKSLKSIAHSSGEMNALQELSKTEKANKTITRYQQFYQGIPVIGAQVMLSHDTHQSFNAQAKTKVNGHLIEDIHLDTKPALNAQEAITLAKKAYFEDNPPGAIQEEMAELQIRSATSHELKLVYLVSFKTNQEENKPIWPFIVVDAQTGSILHQWNNLKSYMDHGPGGNEKVHKYWYGLRGLPSLNVTQNGTTCTMEHPKVKLVNVRSIWDWDNKILSPFQYECDNNNEELANGAYSPGNDAYYFGHVIVDMYKKWYGLNVLQYPNGKPMQLIMRVHFGKQYDNAFWDGQVVSFGDGDTFYPLTVLEIVGHEVTHGFTEQHSNLEYHDEPGALNESLSDMAGQASRAYLLETTPLLYKKAYIQPDITWSIGETIVRDLYARAMRFMDIPSLDGNSADCVDKTLASQYGQNCVISYEDVVTYARTHFRSENERQGFIVHTGSGVFNKAFYLLAQKFGIKAAYKMMIVANTEYWAPTSDFSDAACGVIYSAHDLGMDPAKVQSIFGQVGIDTSACSG